MEREELLEKYIEAAEQYARTFDEWKGAMPPYAEMHDPFSPPKAEMVERLENAIEQRNHAEKIFKEAEQPFMESL